MVKPAQGEFQQIAGCLHSWSKRSQSHAKSNAGPYIAGAPGNSSAKQENVTLQLLVLVILHDPKYPKNLRIVGVQYRKAMQESCISVVIHVIVSQNRGPHCRPPNTIILIIGTPKWYPQICPTLNPAPYFPLCL